jgi:hypothetical protein
MPITTRTILLDPAAIHVTPEAILDEWDCGGEDERSSFGSTVVEMLELATEQAEIRAGFVRFPEEEVAVLDGEIRVGDTVLRPGRVIAGQLDGVTSLVVWATSLGDAFDRWSRGFFDAGDPFLGHLADTIGSVAAEAAATWIESSLDADLAAEGLGSTRRLSPGYCGWDVADQRGLFALLPAGFCGIRLNSSAFMEPVKSVSGILGAGDGVLKDAVPCRRCDEADCPNREGS